MLVVIPDTLILSTLMFNCIAIAICRLSAIGTNHLNKRYGLYPYPGSPNYLEIEQLEANPTSRGETAQRLIEPIGKWLIWYSTKVGLQYCSGKADEPLVVLAAITDTEVTQHGN